MCKWAVQENGSPGVCVQYVDNPAWGTQGVGDDMVTNDYSSSLSLSTGRTPLGKTASPGGGKQKRSHCEGEAVRHFLLWEEIQRNVLPAPVSPTPAHDGPGSQTVSSNHLAIRFVFLCIAILGNHLMHNEWFVLSVGTHTNNHDKVKPSKCF